MNFSGQNQVHKLRPKLFLSDPISYDPKAHFARGYITDFGAPPNATATQTLSDSHFNIHNQLGLGEKCIDQLHTDSVGAVVLLLRSDVKQSASIFRRNVKHIRNWLEEESKHGPFHLLFRGLFSIAE